MNKVLADMKPIPKDLSPEERKKLVESRAKESAMAGAQASVKAMLKATGSGGVLPEACSRET